MKYLDTVFNLSRAVRAWQRSTYILGICLIIAMGALAYQATHQPSYLVPYNFAITDKPVKLKPGDIVDKDYLSYLAIADLKLILDWTPENVKTQYARFLKRTSPNLYKSQNIELIKESDDYSRSAISQVFQIEKTQVQGNEVQLRGLLYRWEGEKQVIKASTTYTLTYLLNGGIPYVDQLNIQQ